MSFWIRSCQLLQFCHFHKISSKQKINVHEFKVMTVYGKKKSALKEKIIVMS
jgi:hypothetical protein